MQMNGDQKERERECVCVYVCVFCHSLRDHLVDEGDILENCSLPSPIYFRFFRWFVFIE